MPAGTKNLGSYVKGIRAALIHDHFSPWQSGRTVGLEVAWELVQAYLAAERGLPISSIRI
jgi:hypothetical protein